MKRLKTFFARRGAVPAACYILAVAVWLVLSLAHAGSDALAKAQGRMTEQIIPVQSWQLVGLEPAEEQATAESALTLTTTNGDPANDFGGCLRPCGAHAELHGNV